jgi:predicted Zn-dependent protease
MLSKLFFILFSAFLFSCNDSEVFGNSDESKEVNYSYSCLDSAVNGKSINRKLEKAGDIIRDLGVSEKSITDSLQTAYGVLFHQQMVEEGAFKLIQNAALDKQLNQVMQKLLAARENPSKIAYKVYALNDTAINAFTFGGRIYVTQAMLQKCQGKEALLYAIIGHEIGHSERGHIKHTIQEMELSSKIFGEENGATFFQLKKLLTASFNQKNELEADYYGIDLTNKLGYDVCTAVSFWKEMGSKENDYSQLEDFFRTHPFSDLRAQCLTDHIRNNFGKQCGLNKEQLLPEVVKE